MKVSNNFDDKEFFKIDTYQSILSTNSLPAWFLDKELIKRIQEIRDYFNKPITINRGFATQSENITAGGVKWSQHLFGRACDFRIAGVTSKEIITFIESKYKNGAYGAITEFDVHIDTRNNDTPIEIKY